MKTRRADGGLPQRPRSHVLEAESIQAFERALPKQWIWRREALDYGLDGSVEVVTPDGSVTGQRFDVQLKATDETKPGRARSANLGAPAARYYAGLDRPVLIVRYVAAEHALYARWFHDVRRPEAHGRSEWQIVGTSIVGAVGHEQATENAEHVLSPAEEESVESAHSDALTAANPHRHRRGRARRADATKSHGRGGRAKGRSELHDPPVRVRFTEDDRWSTTTPHRIAEVLDGWRWIRASSLLLPATLRVECEAEVLHGHERHALVNALAHVTEQAGSLFAVDDTPSARRDRVALCLSLTGTDVVLPAGYRARLDWSEEALATATPLQIAANLLLVVALALGNAGYQSTARRLITAIVARATLLGDVATASWVGRFYCADGAGAELVELAGRIVAPDARAEAGPATALDAASALLAPLWFAYPRMAIAARAPVSVALVGFAHALLTGAWPDELTIGRAVLTFNVGHFVGLTCGDARLALPHYATAARLDPEYRTRAHFWAEVAGLLFDVGRYRWSARAYQRAMELNPADADLLGRRADALAHTRDFGHAQAEFAAYLARREVDWGSIAEPTAEAPASPTLLPDIARYSAWWLKAITLPHVAAADQSSVESPMVSVHAGSEAQAPAVDPTIRTALAAANTALARDPLNAGAWFRRGLESARLGRDEDAWVAFTTAACYAPGDVEAWANAAFLAMTPARQELLLPIVWAAYALHNDVFRRSLDHLVGRNDPSARERLRSAISFIVQAAQPFEQLHEIRLLLSEGAVRVVALKPERDA